jgi:hypothetical protein
MTINSDGRKRKIKDAVTLPVEHEHMSLGELEKLYPES